MVQRSRSHRSELEMASAQGISKGCINLPNTSGHATRPCRQFSTRSRAKSTASFKGLHRILPIDSASDMDSCYNFGEHSFRKSRSSDSLYRKKAMSGLNMTALARVRSHPSHINQTSRSRSGSITSSAYSPGGGSVGLKPGTSKTRHSVVDLHDGDAVCDDDTTTDEEVEYFSDEEDDDGETKSPKCSPTEENLTKRNPVRVQRTPEESKMLSKSFSELTLPYQNREGDTLLVNQPSYKAPSSWIRPQQELLPKGYNDKNMGGNPEFPNVPEGGTTGDNDKIDNDMASADYRDDHIDNPNLNNINHGTIIEADAHSLKRQGKNFPGTTQESGSPVMGVATAMATTTTATTTTAAPEGPEGKPDEGNHNYLSQRSSDTQQYVHSMILSQSTGMERRFDQPASVHNSFANNYHHAVEEEHPNIEGSMGVNKENHLTDSSNFQTSVSELPRQPQLQPQIQPQLQRAPQEQPSAAKNNISHNFSTSISSLTSTLQNMAPENAYSTSRMGHLLRKKPSQLSFPGSSLRGSHSDMPTSFLHRESPASSSDINNFSQFLKSDTMDGESRTQRKLWLQRENSIMDLSSQHDSTDSIFMATNIEVKRECERISHEYTNVRRFSNPIEEALSRVESEQKHMGADPSSGSGSGSGQTSTDILDAIFSNPVNGTREMDEILSQSHNSKLHNILQCIWKEESTLFNKDISPVIRNNKSPTSGHASRTSVKNAMGSGAALQHQRMINSLQPTTRAVNRRMENALHHQQRL